MIRTHVICEAHRTTALVGPGTPLDELECVTCVAIFDGLLPGPVPTDPEEIFVSQITSHHNGHNGDCCCGTCEPDFCFDCGHYAQFCRCFHVEILSPDFCAGGFAHADLCPVVGEPPF